jgi:hypothetical protein
MNSFQMVWILSRGTVFAAVVYVTTIASTNVKPFRTFQTIPVDLPVEVRIHHCSSMYATVILGCLRHHD